MLKQPSEIENYDLKANVLRENGWTDLWHPDNWVRKIWYNDPTINIDRAGMSTDAAYSIYAKKENLPVVYKTEWVKST